MSETCENCRFFKGYEQSDVGHCRRYPPRLVAEFLEVDGDDCDMQDILGAQTLPVVAIGEWCGEWKTKTSYFTAPRNAFREALFACGLNARERRYLVELTDHEVDIGWVNGFDKLRKIEGIGETTVRTLNMKRQEILRKAGDE